MAVQETLANAVPAPEAVQLPLFQGQEFDYLAVVIALIAYTTAVRLLTIQRISDYQEKRFAARTAAEWHWLRHREAQRRRAGVLLGGLDLVLIVAGLLYFGQLIASAWWPAPAGGRIVAAVVSLGLLAVGALGLLLLFAVEALGGLAGAQPPALPATPSPCIPLQLQYPPGHPRRSDEDDKRPLPCGCG